MNCSNLFFKTSVALIRNIKKRIHAYGKLCVVIYVHACTDGGGGRLEKCLGYPIPWEKKSGSVHDMYIVRACISCIPYHCTSPRARSTTPIKKPER